MKRAKPVSAKEIEKLGRLQCTEREAAAWLNIRHHEFPELLERNPDLASAWERGQQTGRISLRRKQFRLAGANAAMAIFLGKNLLGQRDVSVHEVTGEDGGPVEFDAAKLSQKERDSLRTLLARGAERGSTAKKSRSSRR
jgi:hypothetical protein